MWLMARLASPWIDQCLWTTVCVIKSDAIRCWRLYGLRTSPLVSWSAYCRTISLPILLRQDTHTEDETNSIYTVSQSVSGTGTDCGTDSDTDSEERTARLIYRMRSGSTCDCQTTTTAMKTTMSRDERHLAAIRRTSRLTHSQWLCATLYIVDDRYGHRGYVIIAFNEFGRAGWLVAQKNATVYFRR